MFFNAAIKTILDYVQPFTTNECFSFDKVCDFPCIVQFKYTQFFIHLTL